MKKQKQQFFSIGTILLKNEMVSKLIAFVTKYRVHLCLLVIFCLGLSLRSYNFNLRYFYLLGFDEARDLIVAKHIAENGEVITRGPEAFGGMGTLTNSAGYYYALALMWYFSKSVEVFYWLWLLLMSSLIIISFIVAKQFFNTNTGLILSLLVAISPEFIFESKNYYQPYFLPFFIFIFLSFISKKNFSLLVVFTTIFFLLIGLHFHYGVLLVIPVGTIWIFFKQAKNFKKSTASIAEWVMLLTFYFLVGLVWVMATYTQHPFDQIGFISSNLLSTNLLSFGEKLTHLYVELGRSFWRVGNLFTTTISLLLLLPLGSTVLRKSGGSQSSERETVVFLFLLLSSVIWCVFSRALIYEIYLLALLPIYYLLLAKSLSQLIKNKPCTGFIVLFLVVIFSIGLYKKEEDLIAWHGSIYKEIDAIVNKIDQDYQTTEGNLDGNELAFSVAVLTPHPMYFYDGWGSTAFWFLLEEKYQKNLIKISDERYKANIEPLYKNTDQVYFICEHRFSWSENERKECLEKFLQGRSYFLSHTIIYDSTKFTVWSLDKKKHDADFSYRLY